MHSSDLNLNNFGINICSIVNNHQDLSKINITIQVTCPLTKQLKLLHAEGLKTDCSLCRNKIRWGICKLNSNLTKVISHLEGNIQ